MKRSCAGDNSPIIKKRVRDNNINKPKEKETTDTPTTPTPNSTSSSTSTSTSSTTATTTTTKTSDMSVLRYVHDLVHNLEQGNIDHCLSNNNNTKTENLLEQLSKEDADLFNALELNLKKIAQRQLQLETENLRCRIMIQQQHQLLTAIPTSHHEEPKVTHNKTKKIEEIKENDEETNTTSEDNLTSVHDSSLLEKLEASYRQMPNTIPELPQGGYFGN